MNAPPPTAPRPGVLALIALGAVAGVLSGLFGVGGGVLIVPALVMLLAMPHRLAHGTSLAAVVPISVVGAVAYLLHGSVDLRVAALLMAGTVAGAMWGARLLDWLPERILRWAFIAFIAFVAARMFFEVPDRAAGIDLTVPLALTLVGVGLATGILSGLLGVGGGVFLVPVMVVLLGFGDITAKGVSLLVVVPTGLVATVISARRGNVDVRAAAAIGVAGAATSTAGAALAFLLEPRLAAILFAAFLVLIAVRMALQAVRTARTQKQSDPATTP